MRQERPQKGSDGHPLEFHHTDGSEGGGLGRMTRTEHRLGENYVKNHLWLGKTLILRPVGSPDLIRFFGPGHSGKWLCPGSWMFAASLYVSAQR